ncbi:MAG: FecR family protein, partial [Thermodesulfobacteriota bacterium]
MERRYLSNAYTFCMLLWVVAALLFPAGIAAQEKGASNEPAGLPEALKGMAVSDTFIPLFAEVVGTIQSVNGRLIVRHGDTVRAYYAAAGNPLYENDTLYTLNESRCRIKFITEDIITMGANSSISVDQLVDDRNGQEKRSVFSMLKGKAMFYALRLFRYKKITAEVHTPTAVAGIRGTKFGIEVIETERRQALVRSVYLADASGGLLPGLIAQNSPGEGSQTIVYGFDGEVEVTATGGGSTQVVGAGENVTIGPEGVGGVETTPPDVAQQFVGETDAPSGETGGGEGTGETGTGGDETGEDGDTQTGEDGDTQTGEDGD